MILRKGSLLLGIGFLFMFFLINRFASASILPTNLIEKQDSLGTNYTSYMPIILNNFDSTLGIPPIGVQMYGNTGETSQFHDGLVQLGASWVRSDVNWSSAEPVLTIPPTYNWGSVDNALAVARPDMGGLNIIATIRRMPDWAADGIDEPIYPENYDEFAQFVSALVERYDGDGLDDATGSPVVLYWEIFNESDNFNWWGHKGKEFADLLEVVYPALKAANPKAQLVFPGIAYDLFEDENGTFTRSFFTDVLDNGGGNYFDVMNFHSYPIFHKNWTTNRGPSLLEKGQHIQGILEDYNLTKPIVVTETGWHSNDIQLGIPGSEEVQARYVIELMTQGYAIDAKIIIWWLYYDIGGAYEFDNGLVTNTDPPIAKLAYSIYQDIVDILGTAHFVRKLTESETGFAELEAYEFNDNVKNRQLFIAWLNPAFGDATESLRLPVAQATVRDPIASTQFSVTDGSDGTNDGYITVTVGANPLIVEVAK